MASFKKEIKIRDDISIPLGFHVLSIRQMRTPINEKLGPFEIRHYRKMTEYEKGKDELTDNLMFIHSWAAHKESERNKAERKKNK